MWAAFGRVAGRRLPARASSCAGQHARVRETAVLHASASLPAKCSALAGGRSACSCARAVAAAFGRDQFDCRA
eukprot:3074755-Lingulodinium_polyedra.AAC.1